MPAKGVEETTKRIRRRTTRKVDTTRAEDWGKEFVHISKSGKYMEDVGHFLLSDQGKVHQQGGNEGGKEQDYDNEVQDNTDEIIDDEEEDLKLLRTFATIESKYTLPSNEEYNPYDEGNTRERELRGDYIVNSEEFHDEQEKIKRRSSPKQLPSYARPKSAGDGEGKNTEKQGQEMRLSPFFCAGLVSRTLLRYLSTYTLYSCARHVK